MNKKLILGVRLLVPLLIAVSMGTLIFILHAFKRMSFNWDVMLVATLLVYIIFEMDRRVVNYLYQRNPYSNGLGMRFLLPLGLSFLLADGLILAFYTPFKLYQIAQGANDSFHPIYVLTISLQVFFLVLAANAINQSIFLIQRWQEESLRAEQLEREKTQAILNSLKHQISPHFLFNNFNTLYGLIAEDQDLAGEYLLKLSGLYRKVLQNHEEVISIEEEIQAFKDYLFLLKIRFADDVQIDYALHFEEEESFFIPPLSLQTLLENAVKHNYFDENTPLQLQLQRNADRIELCNNLHPLVEEVENTFGIGLENITARYALLSDEEVRVRRTAQSFSVSLPLLTIKSSAL